MTERKNTLNSYDDFNFPERFTALKAEFEAQLQEESVLNKAIAESLARVKL